jgi:uncharacterized membrane protein YdbT with pleckstrin-like domain
MAYYHKVLQNDETVREIGRLHWSIYLPSVFFALIAIALAIVGQWVAVQDPQRLYCFYAAAAVGVITVIVFLGEWMRRMSTEIVITDRRVIYKRGLLSRYTAEMNISRIETVDVIQSLLGRIFNYGTVVVRGTGTGIEPLRRIGHPLRVRNAITVG